MSPYREQGRVPHHGRKVTWLGKLRCFFFEHRWGQVHRPHGDHGPFCICYALECYDCGRVTAPFLARACEPRDRVGDPLIPTEPAELLE